MIVDIILYLVGAFLNFFVVLLRLVTFAIPGWIQSVIHTGVGYLNYLQPLLPISSNPSATGLWSTFGLLDIVGFLLLIKVALFIMHLVIALINMLPFVKRYEHHHQSNASD